jgi:hypothetical protein
MKIPVGKNDVIHMLSKFNGQYSGFGINHEKRKFRANLTIRSVINKSGVYFHYSAFGEGGDLLHKPANLYSSDTMFYNEEYAMIAYDNENKIKMWNLSSNIGTMVKFHLKSTRHLAKNKDIIIFGNGEAEDNSTFREEITIELWENGDVSYTYAWGEIKGLFISRSSVRMKRK